MQTTYNDVKKAVIRSQHCQRNWDLEKEISEADLELLKHAVANCPSKQNMAFYKVHFIQDRNVIESIHSKTDGFTYNFETSETTTNSQVLANLLVVFEATNPFYISNDEVRNDEWYEKKIKGQMSSTSAENLIRDTHVAVGIAAGYANLTASMLGLNTGCCSCYDAEEVATILGADNNIMLLMGIGFKNEDRNRREHHSSDFVFPTKAKQKIQIIEK